MKVECVNKDRTIQEYEKQIEEMKEDIRRLEKQLAELREQQTEVEIQHKKDMDEMVRSFYGFEDINFLPYLIYSFLSSFVHLFMCLFACRFRTVIWLT